MAGEQFRQIYKNFGKYDSGSSSNHTPEATPDTKFSLGVRSRFRRLLGAKDSKRRDDGFETSSEESTETAKPDNNLAELLSTVKRDLPVEVSEEEFDSIVSIFIRGRKREASIEAESLEARARRIEIKEAVYRITEAKEGEEKEREILRLRIIEVESPEERTERRRKEKIEAAEARVKEAVEALEKIRKETLEERGKREIEALERGKREEIESVREQTEEDAFDKILEFTGVQKTIWVLIEEARQVAMVQELEEAKIAKEGKGKGKENLITITEEDEGAPTWIN